MDTRFAALRLLHEQPSSSQKVEFNRRRYRNSSAGDRKRRRLSIGFSCWMKVHLPAPGIFTSSLRGLSLPTRCYLSAIADSIKPLKLAHPSNSFKSMEWRLSNLVKSFVSASQN